MMAATQNTGWRLDALLDGIAAAPSIDVSGITANSTEAGPGDAFVAYQGSTRHGIEFALDAARRGAVAVLTDLPSDDARLTAVREQLPVVSFAGGRATVGTIAARFFAEPTTHLRVVATTGTNGKSSISWLVAEALRSCGIDAGVMGTLGAGRPGNLAPQALTTPDAIGVQRAAAKLRDDGVAAIALEASSHALDQQRLAGTQIDTAIFSNLSRDHLDYHGDMQSYFAAKAALFDHPELSHRVVCTDDEAGLTLWRRHRSRAIRVTRSLDTDARGDGAFVTADAVHASAKGLTIEVASHAGQGVVTSSLIGDFNVQNLLLAFAALLTLGVSVADASAALSGVSAPPGRLQRVADVAPGVFVDFAHTPDALAAALSALRPLCNGQLWCVFGSGGDRDRGKRPEMARIAAMHADELVLTSDNPRSEAPMTIIDDMLSGLEAHTSRHVEVDRRTAINFAVSGAGTDDLVLIAGKGHEQTQQVDGQRLPFDDVAEARIALRQRGRVDA